MAQIKNIFFILLFIIFFVFGVSIIKVIFGDDPSNLDTQDLIGGSGNQETFLIIGVDDLSKSEAILESVWLISIKSAQSQIYLTPLYPAIMPPHDPILISTVDYHQYKDLEIIKKHNIDWDGVILLDLIGLNTVVEVAGERISQKSTQNFSNHLGLPRAWETPTESLQKQKNIVIFLCENSHPFFSYENIKYLMEFIPKQYKSSLSEDELWGKWQSLSNLNINLTCQYSWQDNP